MCEARVCFLLLAIFNQSMAASAKRGKILKAISFLGGIKRIIRFYMMNIKNPAKFCFGNTTLLASVLIPLSCLARLSSPSLAVPLVIYFTPPPMAIKFSKLKQVESYPHTFTRAITYLASYSIRLTIKNIAAYWTSKIFTQTPFGSWSRGGAFQATILLMRPCAIIRKLFITISTNNHSHISIIDYRIEYVKARSLG